MDQNSNEKAMDGFAAGKSPSDEPTPAVAAKNAEDDSTTDTADGDGKEEAPSGVGIESVVNGALANDDIPMENSTVDCEKEGTSDDALLNKDKDGYSCDAFAGKDTTKASDEAGSTESDGKADAESVLGEEEEEPKELWGLKLVLKAEQIRQVYPILCSNTKCNLVACSIWSSSLEPKKPWYSCIDCQERDFGGWPTKEKLPIKILENELFNAMLEKCSREAEPDLPFLSAGEGEDETRTWVVCDACGKARMFHPDTSEDFIENLPDKWYCKDNIFDTERSSCDAEERSVIWMSAYYARHDRKGNLKMKPPFPNTQPPRLAISGSTENNQSGRQHSKAAVSASAGNVSASSKPKSNTSAIADSLTKKRKADNSRIVSKDGEMNKKNKPIDTSDKGLAARSVSPPFGDNPGATVQAGEAAYEGAHALTAEQSAPRKPTPTEAALKKIQMQLNCIAKANTDAHADTEKLMNEKNHFAKAAANLEREAEMLRAEKEGWKVEKNESEMKCENLQQGNRRLHGYCDKLKEDCAAKDGEIKMLRNEKQALENRVASLQSQLARIASVKTAIESHTNQLKMIVDAVDLTGQENEPTNKHPRTESSAKSNLAKLHKQNQKMIQFKQEKNTAELNLRSVKAEKEDVESNLEEVRADLGDANDTVERQSKF